MTKTASFTAILLGCALTAASQEEKETKTTYNQWFIGGGSSIKGFGETDQEVVTADLIFRHARLFFEREEGFARGRHEFWIEAPISFILYDTDNQDSNDIGFIGLNFLAAYIFQDTAIGEPYLMIGGGPQYLMGDIEGVGSDICGNYQAGIGTRFRYKDKHRFNLEIRYHHISNLGMAAPNVPLNSVKIFIGGDLPF